MLVRVSQLRELAGLFLRLGLIGFGGPAAHIALMEHEVVQRRRWLTREAFLDLVSAANLIPGPNSTELAIHIGHRRAGWPGLVVAGACFILPAVVIVTLLAWAYVEYGSLPAASGLLRGVLPIVVVIVADALWRLGKTAITSRWLALLAAAATGLALAGVHELLVLLGAGVAGWALSWEKRRSEGIAARSAVAFLPAATMLGIGAGGASAPSFSLLPLFLFFLKVGSVLYGSGYVLLAFLRADLVERWGWLSETQLLHATAVGQVTPGPVFTTATFIGFLLGGASGALVATLGIFLPAFVFVAMSIPVLPWLQRAAGARAFLKGVNAGSLALLVAVSWHLGRAALADVPAILLAAVSAILLLRFRINPAWLILGGGLAGLALLS